MNKLNHVAFIMDGNGRWGKKRGRGRNFGHLKGVETVKKIVKVSIKLYATSNQSEKILLILICASFFFKYYISVSFFFSAERIAKGEVSSFDGISAAFCAKEIFSNISFGSFG